jgi:hypothetical protein
MNEAIEKAKKHFENILERAKFPGAATGTDAVYCFVEARMALDELAALEVEKPVDDALALVKRWDAKNRGRYVTLEAVHRELAEMIDIYAASYHAHECAKCRLVAHNCYTCAEWDSTLKTCARSNVMATPYPTAEKPCGSECGYPNWKPLPTEDHKCQL